MRAEEEALEDGVVQLRGADAVVVAAGGPGDLLAVAIVAARGHDDDSVLVDPGEELGDQVGVLEEAAGGEHDGLRLDRMLSLRVLNNGAHRTPVVHHGRAQAGLDAAVHAHGLGVPHHRLDHRLAAALVKVLARVEVLGPVELHAALLDKPRVVVVDGVDEVAEVRVVRRVLRGGVLALQDLLGVVAVVLAKLLQDVGVKADDSLGAGARAAPIGLRLHEDDAQARIGALDGAAQARQAAAADDDVHIVRGPLQGGGVDDVVPLLLSLVCQGLALGIRDKARHRGARHGGASQELPAIDGPLVAVKHAESPFA